jgi:hypothetical protein
MGEYPDCRDPDTRHFVALRLQELFHDSFHALQKVKETAGKIRKGIEEISPFIQQATGTVCPNCKDVCCINKHGYYNFEDLVYMHALGLKAPQHDFGSKDSGPCRFLSEKGCSMERAVRPSGCNWYFCVPLLEHMEEMPGYREFDDALGEVVKLWMEMIEEFTKISAPLTIRVSQINNIALV